MLLSSKLCQTEFSRQLGALLGKEKNAQISVMGCVREDTLAYRSSYS